MIVASGGKMLHFNSGGSSHQGGLSESVADAGRKGAVGLCGVLGCSEVGRAVRGCSLCEQHLRAMEVVLEPGEKAPRLRYCNKCRILEDVSKFRGSARSCAVKAELSNERRRVKYGAHRRSLYRADTQIAHHTFSPFLTELTPPQGQVLHQYSQAKLCQTTSQAPVRPA